MTNLFYAFLAPFFVTFEIIHMLGYYNNPKMEQI